MVTVDSQESPDISCRTPEEKLRVGKTNAVPARCDEGTEFSFPLLTVPCICQLISMTGQQGILENKKQTNNNSINEQNVGMPNEEMINKRQKNDDDLKNNIGNNNKDLASTQNIKKNRRQRKRVRSKHLSQQALQLRHGLRFWRACTVILVLYILHILETRSVSGDVLEKEALIVNAVAGQRVTIPCDPHEIHHNGTSWYKEDGLMPRSYHVESGDLTINRVIPSDAGTYVCLEENYEDSQIILNVSPLVPRFAQNPLSYMVLSLPKIYKSIEICFTFMSELNNGLLLHYEGIGSSKNYSLSFGLEDSYPVLIYSNAANHPSTITVREVIEPHAWHAVNLTITHELAYIAVHNKTYISDVEMPPNMSGTLYVGNYPNKVEGFGEGLKGVVGEMQINSQIVNFGEEAEVLQGIEQYNACEKDSCGIDRCVIANTRYRFKCISKKRSTRNIFTNAKHTVVHDNGSCLVEVEEDNEVIFRWTTVEENLLIDNSVNKTLIANFVPRQNVSHLYEGIDPNMYTPFLYENGTGQLTVKKVVKPGFKFLITVTGMKNGTGIQSFDVNGKPEALCGNSSEVMIYVKVINAANRNRPGGVVPDVVPAVLCPVAVVAILASIAVGCYYFKRRGNTSENSSVEEINSLKEVKVDKSFVSNRDEETPLNDETHCDEG